MTMLGQHLVVDYWGCGSQMDDADGVRQAMVDAVSAMGATLLSLRVHTFHPHGVAAVALLCESHLAVHTWPEHGYVAIDAFTCGAEVDPEAGLAVLRQFFLPRQTSARRIARGPAAPEARPARPETFDPCR
jgi:S-adenosylmethionine decarboxylase